MINNTENSEFDGSGSEANVPFNEASVSGSIKNNMPMDKLKEYGKQAYAPLIKVVHKYQGEITPYISALAKGLQGGVDALSGDSASEADRFVAGWFREASEGLSQARTKLESKDINQLVSFIETQAKDRPSLMFTSSYLTGLFFGRIGRHIGKKSLNKKSAEGSSFEDNNGSGGDSNLTH